jgi:hypothetical protein
MQKHLTIWKSIQITIKERNCHQQAAHLQLSNKSGHVKTNYLMEGKMGVLNINFDALID